MNNFRQLHIIRGLAALYVAIGHSKVVFWSGGKSYIEKYPVANWHVGDYLLFITDMFSSAAQEFVIVFFVLSGFFITHSFEKNNWTIKNFLINRIVRIYPPYLFSVLTSVCVFVFIFFYHPYLFSGASQKPIIVRMTNSLNELDFEAFLRALFFLPKNDFIAGNLSYWSLLPEWIFYLIIPFLVTRVRWALIVFGLCYLTNFWGITFVNDLLKFIFEHGFYFFFGAFILILLKNNQWLNKMPPKTISYLILIVLMLVTIGLGAAELSPYSNVAACMLTFWAIITLISYPISGVMFKIGSFLGDISYSLCVFHLPVYYFLYSVLTKQTQTEVFYSRIYWLAIPIAIFISWLTYLIVEQKSMKYIELLKLKIKSPSQ